MGGSDENNPGVIGTANFQGDRKFSAVVGHNRRALSTVNGNIRGSPSYPGAVGKRGLLEKHDDVYEKNQPIQVHRPITRNFAARLANKRQYLLEKSIRDEDVCVDCTITDVEENYDFHLPMFVQHTEALLNETNEMEEVEMEDIDEEEVAEDIDSCDANDPLAVVEYVDDIYIYYRKVESCSCVPPNYMEQQSDINERMRGILVDWLIEVHYKFELMEETLYLTVNIIDRFLAVHPVVRKKLQLVGVTAMLLACKYEEVSVPVIDDLILISDKAYTRKEVLEMEKLMVNTLQFNMSVPTPYVFMRRFLKAAQSDKKLELLSFFIIELCLVEYEMLKFPPSLLAAAAIYTAQCTLSGYMHWSKTCKFYANYSEEQLLECSRMMATFHQNSGAGKLTGVHRKYNTMKFGYTAKSEPAYFLLEANI